MNEPPHTRPHLVAAPTLVPGDRVAVLSPSWAAPAVFPDVHERGLRVIREELELVPVEFPTTRELGASPVDRARDLMAAFSDESIRAIFATIGGSDQITVLPHLDPEVLSSHPTKFFGYSDNTNLLNYLWNLGVVGYHGGSTFVHLARPGGVHPVSMNSLRAALFTHDTRELAPVERFSDFEPSWEDITTLDAEVATEAEPGWSWTNDHLVAAGPSWGGNLEIVHWNLAANRWIRPSVDYTGCILILETSEDMPSSAEVFYMLRNMGERGILERVVGVIAAKPKAWHARGNRLDAAEREHFRLDQRESVLRALALYNPRVPVVVGPDFGHGDPQYVVPYGGTITIDGPNHRITMTY